MGLDITIIEYIGKDDKGYLKTKSPNENLPYSTTRCAVRKKILDNIEFKSLTSGIYHDWAEYYRPTNFKQAYEWADTIEDEGSRKYLYDLFKSLERNENYYLDYGY